MEFNYSALDSFEFETLARDVAEKITNVKLSCYAAGADGGVDASDYYYHMGKQKRVVVQAKHWSRYVSPAEWIETVDRLIDRLGKTQKIPSDELVIVTSARVSEEVQCKIIESGNSKGINHCVVIDSIKLDDFLQKEENKSILKHHFKLWIAGTNILSLMLNRSVDIDTGVFLDQIEDHKGLYVQTSVFDKAVESLRHNSVLLITGDPGTGKSVLTEMIAYQLAAANYQVVYSSCNNIDGIKGVIAPDCENTLFVLDDFLGQRCLDVDSLKMRELVMLLRYVSKLKNCHAVLNSRISILNEAKRIDDSFSRFIESMGIGIVVINTSEMSLLDKARIFLSSLSYGKVPMEYVDSLRTRAPSFLSAQMKCIELCRHDNYNPRIIEFCCRSEFWEGVSPSSFPDAIKEKLDHPNDVWQNEFEERLEKSERMLAYQLFSLGDNNIPIISLKTAYETRLRLEPELDCSVDTFGKALKRLQETIIKTVYIEGEPYVSMANPSVNDYCACFLANNNLESVAMAKSIVFGEQLERITKVNQCPAVISVLRNAIVEGRIFELPFADKRAKSHEQLGFRAIANCEDALNDRDIQWITDFIKIALKSNSMGAWDVASAYLFRNPRKQRVIDSSQMSQILCTVPLLRHLAAGTSYDDAPLLLDALSRGIEKECADNPEVLKEIVFSRGGGWFFEFAVDYLDEWIEENCSPSSYDWDEDSDDESEWEACIRGAIKENVERHFDGNVIKELCADCLCSELADCLDDSECECQFQEALDACIWNISIPTRNIDHILSYSSSTSSNRLREITLIEQMFDDYRID